ncbi:MAG TPA: hypothetical protein VHS96_07800, partial [Bacteroidia bacterium]|nr:hypothetical protein [Bacteroidia bacterium]
MAARCKSKVMICGYPNEMYDDHLADWWQSTAKAFTTGMKDGAQVKRVEKIWCNYQPKLTLL